MRTIFTATVGRSGSDFLARAINAFGLHCVAEHEPPNLLLARLGHWPLFSRRGWLEQNSGLAQFGRNFQRRWLFTDEMLGRGRAFDMVEHDDREALARLAARRVRRLEGYRRRGLTHYFEVSQFFIMTLADPTADLLPDLALIKLTRDPLAAARSLANRDKDLFAGGPPPDWQQNHFHIEDWSGLSRFQIFLHRWIENELRFHDFVERRSIADVFYIKTETLHEPETLHRLFEHFGVGHRPVKQMKPTNTNETQYGRRTVVSDREVTEFNDLLTLLPDDKRRCLAYLQGYVPRAGDQQERADE